MSTEVEAFRRAGPDAIGLDSTYIFLGDLDEVRTWLGAVLTAQPA